MVDLSSCFKKCSRACMDISKQWWMDANSNDCPIRSGRIETKLREVFAERGGSSQNGRNGALGRSDFR